MDTINLRPIANFSRAAPVPSRTETTQAARIAELEAQLTAVEKERDIYTEVVMKK